MFNKHDFSTDNNLSHDQIKKLWLSVYRSKGIGNITFWKHYQSDRLFSQCIKSSVEQEIHNLKKFNGHLVACFEEHFPSELFCLNAPPPLLSAKGNLNILKKPTLAIVGARNASIQGMKIAFEISHFLTQTGFTIASGLARGIDKAAHEGAMQNNSEQFSTIAVLAGGLDQIYPHEHQDIYHAIAQKGIILSEMPFGQSPIASLFPRRNHLIAALSKGIIIIEASLGSGTMITAEQGIALGKDIFVIPGSIKDPRYKGSHKLIKNGAILIDHPQDILDYYELSFQHPAPSIFKSDKHESSKVPQTKEGNITSHITKMIPDTGINIEDLYLEMNKLHLQSSEISNIISKLEFDGVIQRTQDGKFYLS